VTDIGTGTLTIMTQIAADAMGMSIDDVIFTYGDSKKPFAPLQGGSFTTATVGSAVLLACKELKKKMVKLVKKIPHFDFSKAGDAEIIVRDAQIYLQHDPSKMISFADLIAANGGKAVRTTNTSTPKFLTLRKYAKAAHSAAFVEVEVDRDLGTITVTRALTAVAAGRIINPKTARSQILGGMVWGIGKALSEETLLDSKLGKYMNVNLAEYHIPVHADIHDLDVMFVDEKDEIINELGVKGVGEIGIVAMTAAITNAIYHATGKRINDLPVHFDRLLNE
ncbi:MAG: molybdopterin cofactor-binding domain-containing protein, partial [Chitinophagaceae bacterium]